MDQAGTDEAGSGRARDLERFLTFVDAVVAIAITLLILPLVDVAGELSDDESVGSLLRHHQPQLYAFLLSFWVIARMWLGQHAVVRTLVVQDRVVTYCLMGWLLAIVFLPFPTALVAKRGSDPVTEIAYIGTLAVASTMLTAAAWRVARTRSIRDHEAGPDPAYAIVTSAVMVSTLVLVLVVPAVSYYPLLLLVLTDRLVDLWRRLRNGSRTTAVGR